jgi:hypothetical protein
MFHRAIRDRGETNTAPPAELGLFVGPYPLHQERTFRPRKTAPALGTNAKHPNGTNRLLKASTEVLKNRRLPKEP